MKKGYWSANDRRRHKAVLRRALLIGALGLALIIALLSLVVYVLKSDKPGLPRESTTLGALAPTSTTAPSRPEPTGRSGLLFALLSSEGGVDALWYLDADLNGRLITVFASDPALGGLDDAYRAGGMSRLAAAYTVHSGKPVTRYAGITDKNFVKAIKQLGEVEVYVENAVEYTQGEASLRLSPGLQKLDFNTLGLYLTHGAQNKADLLALQAETLSKMLLTYINPKKLANSKQLFSSLLDLAGSDISPRDCVEALPALEWVASEKIDIISGVTPPSNQ